MKKVMESIVKQVEANSHINLFYRNFNDIIKTDVTFVAELRRFARAGLSESELNELITFTVDRSLNALYRMNQYIHVTSENRRELHTIYRTTWEMIRQNGDIEATLVNHHYPAIRKWLEHRYPDILVKQLKNVDTINHVVCEEYSAEFQIAMLGIDTATVTEPVIDVGCGKHFHLVKYLREHGVDCIGIDRQLNEHQPFLHEANWLDFHFKPGTWGTVISNMSFSNHLLHHYTMKSLIFAEYARKYREILDSLKPNGMFVYAPSVDFVEEYIDRDTYHVILTPVSDTIERARVRKIY